MERLPLASTQLPERGAQQLVDACPAPAHPHHAALEPNHAQQVGHHTIHPKLNSLDADKQLHAILGGKKLIRLNKAAGGPNDCGQRRAQLMRDGVEQRCAHPLGFCCQLRQLRFLSSPDARHGSCRNSPQRFQAAALLLRQRDLPLAGRQLQHPHSDPLPQRQEPARRISQLAGSMSGRLSVPENPANDDHGCLVHPMVIACFSMYRLSSLCDLHKCTIPPPWTTSCLQPERFPNMLPKHLG